MVATPSRLSPPLVSVQTPAQGGSYGGTVPITWTASAPEGLYAFDIQYSLDGGVYWRLLVEDLPESARSYTWVLPPNVTLNSGTKAGGNAPPLLKKLLIAQETPC